MALTQNDLAQIRDVVHSVINSEVPPMIERAIKPLQDEIQALRNDVKEIYVMIDELKRDVRGSKDDVHELKRDRVTDKSFNRLTLEEKLLKINAELLAAAKQAGIALPR